MRFVLCLVLIVLLPRFIHAQPMAFADRWMYYSTNLLVDKNVDPLIDIMRRAAKVGYTGVVLADFKFNILGRMPERYFKNVERVKQAATQLQLEIIPTVFPIGYSSGILIHDPNLAEGLPVKESPYRIQRGEAILDAPAPEFRNGDLEQVQGNRFTGFGFQDGIGMTTFADREVVHRGKVSCRMQNAAENCRLFQKVKVRPWSCYRFSCWVKTSEVKPTTFRLLALPTSKGGRNLTFHEAHLKEKHDWSLVDVVFNSLEETEVGLYLGVWGGFQGKIWVDSVAVEEVSFVNLLRRSGCPLLVTSADGKQRYEEGKDFLPLTDDKLGLDPNPGDFQFHHSGPKLRLTPKSRIQEGDSIRVSWYHPVLIHGEQVPCSLIEPKVFDLLRDQAKRVNELFHPRTFFMSHDEIRVAGWCQLAEQSGKTPGELLASNVQKCVKILREISPQARIVVWSDMFDPNHNATDRYYLVKGTLKGSWMGLPKDVIIANWNGGKAAASLKWFDERGHTQVIAGYYDSDLKNYQKWSEAARGIKTVQGFMYTTWQHRYQHLEAYGNALMGK